MKKQEFDKMMKESFGDRVTNIPKTDKILVSDSKFLECVDEIAIQITEMNFGADTWVEAGGYMMGVTISGETIKPKGLKLSKEAQEFYNDKFDEYEDLINNKLNVWNKQREL